MAGDLWVVVLDTGGESGPRIYGPFQDQFPARDFAAFLTAEVDPATYHPLRDPTGELLGYWRGAGEGWGPDVADLAAAGAGLAYAIWYGGVEFAKTLPEPIARAYMRACEAYRISHATTPTEQPNAAEGTPT